MKTSKEIGSVLFSQLLNCLNKTHWEKLCLHNSVQEFIEMEVWLLLTFFLCFQLMLINYVNQLSSQHFTVIY